LAITDWRLRRWSLWFLALSNAPHLTHYRLAMPSETDIFILEDLFSSVLSQFKISHVSGNLTFNNLVIFQSLELRILVEKIVSISIG